MKSQLGYSVLHLGEKKESQDSFNDIGNMLIIALAMIFFILAALFKSLIDPLVIMFAIPFAIVGVIIGHMIFGYNLQFLSMIGFLSAYRYCCKRFINTDRLCQESGVLQGAKLF